MAATDFLGGVGSLVGGAAIGGPAGLGVALGANLLGSLFGVASERSRRKKLRARLLAENAPLEALLRTRQFGPSESEGALSNIVQQRTLSDLASRGVLNSSISAPAVAQAVAPIENQRQQRTQGLMERIVAARQAIVEGTSLPGYGAAFGESFGEAGDLIALFSAMNQRGGSGQTSVQEEFGFGQEPPQPDPYSDMFPSAPEEESEFGEMGRLVRRGKGRR